MKLNDAFMYLTFKLFIKTGRREKKLEKTSNLSLILDRRLFLSSPTSSLYNIYNIHLLYQNSKESAQRLLCTIEISWKLNRTIFIHNRLDLGKYKEKRRIKLFVFYMNSFTRHMVSACNSKQFLKFWIVVQTVYNYNKQQKYH